jgi:hypothetical protein
MEICRIRDRVRISIVNVINNLDVSYIANFRSMERITFRHALSVSAEGL